MRRRPASGTVNSFKKRSADPELTDDGHDPGPMTKKSRMVAKGMPLSCFMFCHTNSTDPISQRTQLPSVDLTVQQKVKEGPWSVYKPIQMPFMVKPVKPRKGHTFRRVQPLIQWPLCPKNILVVKLM
jgi:hypothetical protein